MTLPPVYHTDRQSLLPPPNVTSSRTALVPPSHKAPECCELMVLAHRLRQGIIADSNYDGGTHKEEEGSRDAVRVISLGEIHRIR